MRLQEKLDSAVSLSPPSYLPADTRTCVTPQEFFVDDDAKTYIEPDPNAPGWFFVEARNMGARCGLYIHADEIAAMYALTHPEE